MVSWGYCESWLNSPVSLIRSNFPISPLFALSLVSIKRGWAFPYFRPIPLLIHNFRSVCGAGISLHETHNARACFSLFWDNDRSALCHSPAIYGEISRCYSFYDLRRNLYIFHYFSLVNLILYVRLVLNRPALKTSSLIT